MNEQNSSLTIGKEYYLATQKRQPVTYIGRDTVSHSHVFVKGLPTTEERTDMVFIMPEKCTVSEGDVEDHTSNYTTFTLANLRQRDALKELIDQAFSVEAQH